LIGHWPLRGDARDRSSAKLATTAREVDFDAAGPGGEPRSAARFSRNGAIEVSPAELLHLGTENFSLALWVRSDGDEGESPGDLISCYDPATRTGFHLGLYSHGGVTNSQPNSRQLHFGIDQGKIEEEFLDHGRLGNAIMIFASCVHDGRLYAATCHAGENEAGHVFRFEGEDRWTDLGSPDRANSISALAVYDGALYAASSKYRLAGSALAESQNPHFGGKVFRLGADDRWVPCGRVSRPALRGFVVPPGRVFPLRRWRAMDGLPHARWQACGSDDGLPRRSLRDVL
jgi:hypothetical protein